MKFINKFIVIFTLVFFFASMAQAAEPTLPIGEKCQSNDQCIYGDCEASFKTDPSGEKISYCDCDEDKDCDIYKKKDSDVWKCVDGGYASYDLDYCFNESTSQVITPLKELNDNQSVLGLLADAVFDKNLLGKYLQSKVVDDINDQINIKIPGLNFSKFDRQLDGEGYIKLTWLGEYIRAIYNFGLGIVSIVAVIMIIMQGFRIITSGGGEGKTEGFKKIGHVVVGLVIAWGSYTILYTINPDLVKFEALKIKYIMEAKLPPEDTGAYIVEDIPDADIPDLTKFADLQTVQLLNVPSDEKRYFRKDAIPSLESALRKYNEYIGASPSSKSVNVNSSYRGPEPQYALMQKYCGCPPASSLPNTASKQEVANNYCSACKSCRAACIVGKKDGKLTISPISHAAGYALDMNSVQKKSVIECSTATKQEKDSSGVVKTKEYDSSYCIPKEQQLLIRAMVENNFCVGLKPSSNLREGWHFEYMGSGVKNTIFCTNDKSDLQKLHWVNNNQ